jgi:hypothetical protein
MASPSFVVFATMVPFFAAILLARAGTLLATAHIVPYNFARAGP